MLKSLLVISILILSFTLVTAQEKGKLRAGLETGLLVPHQGGAGLAGAVELKYNFKNNMNFGLRAERASYIKHEDYDADLSIITAGFDYYFGTQRKKFIPFGGAGLGYYFCNATDNSLWGNEYVTSHYNNPTFYLRMGAESGRWRMALAYNSIRKQNELNTFNRNSDYICLYLGFYIGGGKWRK